MGLFSSTWENDFDKRAFDCHSATSRKAATRPTQGSGHASHVGRLGRVQHHPSAFARCACTPLLSRHCYNKTSNQCDRAITVSSSLLTFGSAGVKLRSRNYKETCHAISSLPFIITRSHTQTRVSSWHGSPATTVRVQHMLRMLFISEPEPGYQVKDEITQ